MEMTTGLYPFQHGITGNDVDGTAERPYKEIAPDSRKILNKLSPIVKIQMFDIRCHPAQDNARELQFRPTARIGIPLSLAEPTWSEWRNVGNAIPGFCGVWQS